MLLVLRGQLDELFILIRLAKEVQAFKRFAAYQFTVEQVAPAEAQGVFAADFRDRVVHQAVIVVPASIGKN